MLEKKKKAREEQKKLQLAKGGTGNKAKPPPPDDGCIIDRLLDEIREGTTLRPTKKRSTIRKGSAMNYNELQKLKTMAEKSEKAEAKRASVTSLKSAIATVTEIDDGDEAFMMDLEAKIQSNKPKATNESTPVDKSMKTSNKATISNTSITVSPPTQDEPATPTKGVLTSAGNSQSDVSGTKLNTSTSAVSIPDPVANLPKSSSFVKSASMEGDRISSPTGDLVTTPTHVTAPNDENRCPNSPIPESPPVVLPKSPSPTPVNVTMEDSNIQNRTEPDEVPPVEDEVRSPSVRSQSLPVAVIITETTPTPEPTSEPTLDDVSSTRSHSLPMAVSQPEATPTPATTPTPKVPEVQSTRSHSLPVTSDIPPIIETTPTPTPPSIDPAPQSTRSYSLPVSNGAVTSNEDNRKTSCDIHITPVATGKDDNQIKRLQINTSNSMECLPTTSNNLGGDLRPDKIERPSSATPTPSSSFRKKKTTKKSRKEQSLSLPFESDNTEDKTVDHIVKLLNKYRPANGIKMASVVSLVAMPAIAEELNELQVGKKKPTRGATTKRKNSKSPTPEVTLVSFKQNSH